MIALCLLLVAGVWAVLSFAIPYWILGLITLNPLRRKAGAFLLALVLFFLPFADEIAAQYSVNQACAAEGASRIYSQIRVSDGFYTSDGKPEWTGLQDQDIDFFIGNLTYKNKIAQVVGKKWTFAGGLVPVEITEYCLADPSTKTVLACNLSKKVHGGWIARYTQFKLLSLPMPACRKAPGLYEASTLSQIFVYAPSTSGGGQ